jgi:hypothetical protein
MFKNVQMCICIAGFAIFYAPMAFLLHLRNSRVYSKSPSIFCLFTDPVHFPDFLLRDSAGCYENIISRKRKSGKCTGL